MTTLQCTIFSYGIKVKVLYVNMQFSLHLALMKPSLTRFGCLLLTKELPPIPISQSSKIDRTLYWVILGSLIELLSRSTSLGTMAPIRHGSILMPAYKMYYMNNIGVLDHRGLFIYFDIEYLVSY